MGQAGWIILAIVVAAVIFFGLRYLDKAKTAKKKAIAIQPYLDAQKRGEEILKTLTQDIPAVPGVLPRIVCQPGAMTPETIRGVQDAFIEMRESANRKVATGEMKLTGDLQPSECTILVFPAVRQNPPAFPVFIPAGTEYDDSDFDQEKGTPGGFLYAVEEVETIVGQDWVTVPSPNNLFKIAKPNTYDEAKTAARAGFEHLFAYHAISKGYYLMTRDHVPAMTNLNNPVSHPFI